MKINEIQILMRDSGMLITFTHVPGSLEQFAGTFWVDKAPLVIVREDYFTSLTHQERDDIVEVISSYEGKLELVELVDCDVS